MRGLMSDLSKIAEMAYRDNQRREFKFESRLSQWLKRTMCDKGVTRFDIAKATGLTVVQISEYMHDYNILTEEHDEKFTQYFNKLFKQNNECGYFMALQSEGVMVDLVEKRKEWDDFLARLKVDNE